MVESTTPACSTTNAYWKRPPGGQRALQLQLPGADVPLDRLGLVVAPLIAGFRLREDGVRELARVRAGGHGRQHRQHRGRARHVVRPPPARRLCGRRFYAELVCRDRHGAMLLLGRGWAEAFGRPPGPVLAYLSAPRALPPCRHSSAATSSSSVSPAAAWARCTSRASEAWPGSRSCS